MAPFSSCSSQENLEAFGFPLRDMELRYEFTAEPQGRRTKASSCWCLSSHCLLLLITSTPLSLIFVLPSSSLVASRLLHYLRPARHGGPMRWCEGGDRVGVAPWVIRFCYKFENVWKILKNSTKVIKVSRIFLEVHFNVPFKESLFL